MGPSVERELTLCLNGSTPLNKMAAIHIYGKALKNLHHQNQESFETESWYTASESQGLSNCSNDDHRLTFDILWQGQMCVPTHLYRKSVEKSFSQNVLKTNG